MHNFKPFSTHLLGSLPRSSEILNLRRRLAHGEDVLSILDEKVREETKRVVALQEKYDIDIITNGEFSRDNYVSFVSEKLNGVKMMNMMDVAEYIDDKQAFEEVLQILDVPSISIKNAIATGKVSYKDPLVYEEIKFLKTLTNRPVKATLPGPYLMTRSMWLKKLTGNFYKNKEELGVDVVKVLKEELTHLKEIECDLVQFDEPVLTEVVFTKGHTRSFMCAALSEKKDPTDELKFAESLLKEVVDFAKKIKLTVSLHVCRGNWSKDESTLLKGPYTPLVPLFESVLPDILTLEFSTPRAGELKGLLGSEILSKKITLGLGVINPRIDSVETVDSIVKRAKDAVTYLDKERLLLNPDCGFATFSNRPVNTYDIIEDKLKILNEAKMRLRDEFCR